MRTRENNILNLLKRAFFYAADGAVQIKDIIFSEEEASFLIHNFDIYHDYAETVAQPKEESAYHATDEMALYLHENFLPLDSVLFDKWTEFLSRWNEFLYVDCIRPGHLTGLSTEEAKLVMECPLPKEEQYELYEFVLLDNPSTEALEAEIRNRVSAKATGAAGLMSGSGRYRDPNDLQVTLRLG